MNFPEPLAGRWVALATRDQPLRGGSLHPESYLECKTNCSSQKMATWPEALTAQYGVEVKSSCLMKGKRALFIEHLQALGTL